MVDHVPIEVGVVGSKLTGSIGQVGKTKHDTRREWVFVKETGWLLTTTSKNGDVNVLFALLVVCCRLEGADVAKIGHRAKSERPALACRFEGADVAKIGHRAKSERPVALACRFEGADVAKIGHRAKSERPVALACRFEATRS